MRQRSYGIFLFLGPLAGVVAGLALGEPSLGAVLGLAGGALLALGLGWRRGSG
ncbi:MAG: hypothetical protein NZM40_04095 [Sphingomonadaceae bacterium]|uniref:hypothetical protein n=1 Tax=Thermaurantiacus sp. TaxID=2820283 RepID=UPI00298F3AF3|nr:hypothetical protein [Thermaurantiacus sp.]MCS6986606.1 hypothetical protein [Sphingomonadaceae bacterium]MDW8414133.1 hypothetical protein [Thermaurantiacus sp.]